MDLVQGHPIIKLKKHFVLKDEKTFTPYVNTLPTGSPKNLHRRRITRIGKTSIMKRYDTLMFLKNLFILLKR